MTEVYDNRVAGEDRVGNWMQTHSGRRFFPIDPRADEVFIEDIAAALGKLCRFNGHCRGFYSVAEHSVLVSMVVPREDALAGLLHDATEAYVADVIRPLKPYLAGYAEIEHRVWLAVAEKFGLAPELPESVKIADNAVLLREADEIMAQPPELWNVKGTPANVPIECWSPAMATTMFRARYTELTGEMVP
ncbi:hypothetical protein [Novosphingobium resinovorum]|uniref:Phosphohydrolase n=1 Tax=Novosphingobium resinovorum TaxID=158500 RepID=A0A1D8A364_9SPHN|nr:hypothetical protein [Novosphingobium resinovorum]AOR76534.1 hypothetical protein BES08_07090 [Novosphingobium resinovorum]